MKILLILAVALSIVTTSCGVFTLNVYSHVLPGEQADATAQLERMLYG